MSNWFLSWFVRESGLRTLVETGLWRGHGSGMDVWSDGLLDRYVAVEIDPDSCAQAALAYPYAEVVCGSSDIMLPSVLETLEGPAVFWLDAHDPHNPRVRMPLIGELAAIVAWEHGPQSWVMIDDLPLLGRFTFWPTLPMLRAVIDKFGLWSAAYDDRCAYLRPLAAATQRLTAPRQLEGLEDATATKGTGS